MTWRTTAVLVVLAASAYLMRFLSSWWLLEHTGTDRFDPHGFGLLGDVILLVIQAPFLAVFLAWIVRRRGAWRGLFEPASRPGWTAASYALVLLLGAPTPDQVWAFILLPPPMAWPAVASAALWFAVTALLRAVAITGPVAEPAARSRSTVPSRLSP